MNPHSELPPSPSGARFPVTNWSVVVSAGEGDEASARAALEDLCRAYWPPLYAEIRRRGHSPADAQDLTQEMFERLLQHQSFGTADRNRGRFRSFLLGALNHLLADDWRERRAEKRGGGVPMFSLDVEGWEAWLQNQPAPAAGPAEVPPKSPPAARPSSRPAATR